MLLLALDSVGDFSAFFGACRVYAPFISLTLLLIAHLVRDDGVDAFDAFGADTTEMCTLLAACAWIDGDRFAVPLFCNLMRMCVGFLIFMAFISLGNIGRKPSSVPFMLKKKIGAAVLVVVGVFSIVGLMVVVVVVVVEGERRLYGL